MSKKDTTAEATGWLIIGLIGCALVGLVLFGIYRAAQWVGKESRKEWTCTDSLNVTSVKPIYEDNGKYEDESYEVTYDNGTKGIIDRPSDVEDGTYCRKHEMIDPN